MSWFKSHWHCCSVIIPHFPEQKSSFSPGVSSSFVPFCAAAWFRQIHCQAGCTPGLPHAGDPPLTRPPLWPGGTPLKSCKPCWLHSHTFKDNCSADSFPRAGWDSHPWVWLWALHPDWPAVPAHLPGLLAEANGRDCRHKCSVPPVGFLSRSTPTTPRFWSVNGNT